MLFLIYFIAGMVFILAISPILDSLVSLILSISEVFKAKCAVKVAECNKKIMELEEPQPHMPAIGFGIPTEECECDEDNN